MIDTLRSQPEVGMAGSLGSAFVSWLGVLNPILSFVSLVIGVAVGITTLYLQIQKIIKGNNK